MRLSIPTNWDDALIDGLAGLPIDHYYGKLRTDAMAEQYIEWGPLLSGSVLVILPITIFFLPFAKYFVKGLASGAVKG